MGGDNPDKGEFQPPIAWWYPEPPKAATVADGKTKSAAAVAGATMLTASGVVHPIPIMTSDLQLSKESSFFQREATFARRWLMSKGIMVQEEARNPVDVELERFFEGVHAKKTLVAEIETGMNDSIAVILSNLAMDEERKVHYSEMDKLGLPEAKRT